MHPRLRPYASEAAAVCIRGCSRMHPRLRPYASEAAAVCTRGCSRMHPRLQPYASEAAAVCTRGCSRMHCLRRLQAKLERKAKLQEHLSRQMQARQGVHMATASSLYGSSTHSCPTRWALATARVATLLHDVSYRLQPYVLQAATLCAPGCNPVCSRLQAHVLRRSGSSSTRIASRRCSSASRCCARRGRRAPCARAPRASRVSSPSGRSCVVTRRSTSTARCPRRRTHGAGGRGGRGGRGGHRHQRR